MKKQKERKKGGKQIKAKRQEKERKGVNVMIVCFSFTLSLYGNADLTIKKGADLFFQNKIKIKKYIFLSLIIFYFGSVRTFNGVE